MEFKSNINCSNCEAKVKKVMDKQPAIKSWHVDLEHPDRILTVESDLSPDEISKTVLKAGFKAEHLV
jgi:copper chaperone